MGFNIFKRFKKGDTVIDFSNLQKRGINKEKKDVLDLSSNSPTVESSPLGFLGSLAGSVGEPENAASSRAVSSVIEDVDGKTKLKGLLRDMKSKLDNTYNKIYKLSDRIDLLEKKLERLERRSGVVD